MPNEAVIPWFGARRMARELHSQVAALTTERDHLRTQLNRLGVLSVVELEIKKAELEAALQHLEQQIGGRRVDERVEIRSA